MKSTIASRLTAALLLLAMVLCMVPAAMADDGVPAGLGCISFSSFTYTMEVGATTNLLFLIEGEDGVDYGAIRYSGDDSSVASVSSDGTVTARATGTVTVTAIAANGDYDQMKIIVDAPSTPTVASYLEIDRNLVTLSPGDTATINVYTDVKDSDLSWRSSSNTVCTVTNGTLTAKAPGQCYVTVSAPGGWEKTCQVIVNQPVVEVATIKLGAANLNLKTGQSVNLSATPSGSFGITWSSTNTNVVKVSGGSRTGCNVQAVGKGSAYVYAYDADDRNVYNYCLVTVEGGTQQGYITLSSYAIYPEVGEYIRITASANPSNMPVYWATSNKNIATVDTSGRVYGVKAGTATITAYNNDYNALTTCTVYVDAAKEVTPSINKMTLTAEVGETLSNVLRVYDVPTNGSVYWLVTSGSASYVTLTPSGSNNAYCTVKALRSGTLTITATVYNRYGNAVAYPTCRLTINGSASEITYSTDQSMPANFNASDFTKACNARGGSSLKNVKFTLPSSGMGTLCYDYVNSSSYSAVKANTLYYPSGSSNNLDRVSFIPKSTFSGRATIYYTGTDNNNKTYTGTIIVNVTVPQQQTTTVTNVGTFTDVKSNDWFGDAVQWAVDRNVTTGITKSQFKPSQQCRHCEILLFLYRAYSEPATTIANPYKVSLPSWYSSAAIWAYEKGMVTDPYFDFEQPCSRAQAVEYLWKAKGSPNVGNPSFNDVSTSASYAKAVAWAVDRGVTSGTSKSTFSPDQVCDRGTIVTFLRRDQMKE